MDDLSSRAQHKHLPHTDPVHVSASYGRGAHCAECGRTIGRYELEYEVAWLVPARTVRLHARCYEIGHPERTPNPGASH